MPRPSSLTPEILENVHRLAHTGMSKAKMRAELDISRGTWMGWQRERPEFIAALDVSKPFEIEETAQSVAMVQDTCAAPVTRIAPEPDQEDTAPTGKEPEDLKAIADVQPEPATQTEPHAAVLAKGMIDYAAAQFPNWQPTDFHKVTNAFAYGQRMGVYWVEICKNPSTAEEPPADNREFAEEILAMIADRYSGLRNQDWNRVNQVLHVARTRGIKWGAFTVER